MSTQSYFRKFSGIALLGTLALVPVCSAQVVPSVNVADMCAGSSEASSIVCGIGELEQITLNDVPAVVNGTLGSIALGELVSGDIFSVSGVGQLRSRASISFDIATSPKLALGITQAFFQDTITIDFPPFRGQQGLLFVQYALNGKIAASGQGRSFALVSVATRRPHGITERIAVPYESSVSGLFQLPSALHFIYGEPFGINFLLNLVVGTASPHANGIGFDLFQVIGRGDARADFSNTITLVGLEVTEASGNPLAQPPVFTSASGTQYSENGILVSFSEFSAHVERGRRPSAFEVEGDFSLGTGTHGIAPPTEDVTLQLGDFSATISAGSFTERAPNMFKFEGIINEKPLEMTIKALPNGRYKYSAEGLGANLTVAPQPVTVRLIIGDDGGKAASTPDN